MDNAKQFAYYPVAVLKGVDNFSNGTISMKFKTVAGDSDRCSGILFNVKPNGDWLAVRYNDTENNVALLGVPQRHPPQLKFSDRAKPFMLDRSAWHELKLTVDGADLKAWLDGALALGIHAGQRAVSRQRAAQCRTCIPPTIRCSARRSTAKSASGRRPTAPAISKTTQSAPGSSFLWRSAI